MLTNYLKFRVSFDTKFGSNNYYPGERSYVLKFFLYHLYITQRKYIEQSTISLLI